MADFLKLIKAQEELVALTEENFRKAKKMLAQLKEEAGDLKRPYVGINAGHGGVNPKTGQYVVRGKMFKHLRSDINGMKLHASENEYEWIFEGVLNRYIASKLSKRLAEEGIEYQTFHHEWRDMSLEFLSSKVNQAHRKRPMALLNELHSNATSSHNAEGFIVFTSPGETRSDAIATYLWNQMNHRLNGKMRMRKDTRSDKDVDFEAAFHMVVKTHPPAILPEFGFFDNKNDVQRIMDETIQDEYVEALVATNKFAIKLSLEKDFA